MTKARDKNSTQQKEIQDTEFKSEITKNLWDFWNKTEEQVNHRYEKLGDIQRDIEIMTS